MKVYKRTFFSQILALLHQLRFFNYLTLGWDLALIRYCRRNRTKQEICGIPFYIVKLNQDLTLGLQFVQNALKLLSERSSHSIEAIRKQFMDIIILSPGPGLVPYPTEKCLEINPLIYLPEDMSDIEEMKRNMLAFLGELVSAALEMRASKGRFGYLGIKHLEYLKIKTSIRAFRRCLSLDNHLEVLTVMAIYYKFLDDNKLRPSRRYHPYFIEREMKKWSFDKKLNLHSKIETLVIEE